MTTLEQAFGWRIEEISTPAGQRFCAIRPVATRNDRAPVQSPSFTTRAEVQGWIDARYAAQPGYRPKPNPWLFAPTAGVGPITTGQEVFEPGGKHYNPQHYAERLAADARMKQFGLPAQTSVQVQPGTPINWGPLPAGTSDEPERLTVTARRITPSPLWWILGAAAVVGGLLLLRRKK